MLTVKHLRGHDTTLATVDRCKQDCFGPLISLSAHQNASLERHGLAETTLKLDFKPGAAAQVDWADFGFAAKPETRATLDLLMRDIEHREARLPEAERYDVNRLREALGLKAKTRHTSAGRFGLPSRGTRGSFAKDLSGSVSPSEELTYSVHW